MMMKRSLVRIVAIAVGAVVIVGTMGVDHRAVRAQPADAASQGPAPVDVATKSHAPPAAAAESPPQPAPPEAKIAPEAKAAQLGLLTLLGVDQDRLSGFTDAKPIEGDEAGLLYRMLYAVGRFKLGEIHRGLYSDTPWEKLAHDPAAFRGQIFPFPGRVNHVTREKLPPEYAERFFINDEPLETYYRCELTTDGYNRPVTVYALHVPKEWKLNEAIDERVGVDGFFIKLTGAADGIDAEPHPVFVAQRVAWYPQTVLGDLQMDYGLFDNVTQKSALTAAEGLGFYEMLAAAGRAAPSQLLRHGDRAFPVTALFTHKDPKTGKIVQPTVQIGELVTLTGTATRAIQIRVDDPEIIAVFGIDHYYEVEMVTLDSQGNPITFCVRELPKDMPTGEDIAIDVTLAGFYFKHWTYRRTPNTPQEVSGEVKVQNQVAPLLIGLRPMLIPREPRSNFVGLVTCVLFIVGMAGMWIGVWWVVRRDKHFHTRTIARKFAPPAGVSLDQMDIEDQGPIRFDNPPS